ncbi:hypothetical protein [Desulfonatronum sp. SC1]|uniref:hypothetical protein n=1 Tax=Desulfonatronum sp. SC1 TaxID=2109626 RepID=UPI000D320CD3|nr:hypothetical protein [Desulfonatronum sp. SC1]PTN38028.1 hypothetical protein C6366_03970 [Desulfonatronum sp. SC1]
MRYLTIILILTGVALTTSSCCPARISCAPTVITQPIPAAVPVLPTYGPHRCHPGYVGYCTPYHLPYVTRTTVVNPVLPPYAPCNPCY